MPSTALHALPCRGFHLQHLPGCLPWGDPSFLLLPRWGSACSIFICSTQEPSSHPPSAECRGHHSHAQHRAVPSSEPCPMDSQVWYRAMPNIEPMPNAGPCPAQSPVGTSCPCTRCTPTGFPHTTETLCLPAPKLTALQKGCDTPCSSKFFTPVPTARRDARCDNITATGCGDDFTCWNCTFLGRQGSQLCHQDLSCKML